MRCIVRLYTVSFANGHTTLKTPFLVRSAKLSNVGSDKYLDGWPLGNTRCCWHFAFHTHITHDNCCVTDIRIYTQGCINRADYYLFWYYPSHQPSTTPSSSLPNHIGSLWCCRRINFPLMLCISVNYLPSPLPANPTSNILHTPICVWACGCVEVCA